MKFNLNGRLVDRERARISVLDRGFIYGDGIFETVLIRNSRPFMLEKHLDRLRNSASIVRIDVPWDDDRFRKEVDRVLRVNKLSDAAMRINISRGVGDWRLSPAGAKKPTIVISLFPIPDYPRDTYTRGWGVTVARSVVAMDPVIPSIAKTTNRISLILAKMEAEERGGHEAILLNLHGFLTEGTSSNFFFVRDGEVCTPSLDSGILEGVTRGVVMEILREKGKAVRESLYRPEDFARADEAFLTFTTAGVVPIHNVDRTVFGQGKAGPIAQMVRVAYERRVEEGTGPSRHLQRGR